MDIVFSANNRSEVMILPIVPNDISIEQSQSNDTYAGLSMDLNIIGNLGLRTLELASIFPVNKKYKFIKANANTNGWDYVNFFNRWRGKKVPIRLVITDGSEERLNMACTVDSFSYSADRMGDIAYSLSLREYVFVVV